MTLENLYFIASILAAIGVIASLIFVGVQMRQANRLARLETTRAVWMHTAERIDAQFVDEEHAAFMQKALYGKGELTEAEKSRFYITMSSLMVTMETGHKMHQSGMMEDYFWPRMRVSLRDYIAPPRAQRWWEIARRRTFAPNTAFVAEVDSIVADFNTVTRTSGAE